MSFGQTAPFRLQDFGGASNCTPVLLDAATHNSPRIAGFCDFLSGTLQRDKLADGVPTNLCLGYADVEEIRIFQIGQWRQWKADLNPFRIQKWVSVKNPVTPGLCNVSLYVKYFQSVYFCGQIFCEVSLLIWQTAVKKMYRCSELNTATIPDVVFLFMS